MNYKIVSIVLLILFLISLVYINSLINKNKELDCSWASLYLAQEELVITSVDMLIPFYPTLTPFNKSVWVEEINSKCGKLK